MGRFVVLVAAGVMAITLAPVAHADPPPPGCQRDVLFGLDPKIREVCDSPIQPDGSWTRLRSFHRTYKSRSTCNGYLNVLDCPPFLQGTAIVQYPQDSPVETYVVTWDTIPDGEPGHIDS
jgi:hypothetical protein